MVSEDTGSVGILVVEDLPEMRHLICRMLARGRFPSLDSGTAEHALDLLRVHPEIRLAIIDMVMPGMSGLDLAAEMGRRHPGIEILYISGYVASIAIQAIHDRKPDAVLLKPFTEQKLLARVRRLLDLPGDTTGDPDPLPLTVETAWDRLIEGSDRLEHPYRIASYRDTAAAYSIAAAHAAVLRQAAIPYQFERVADRSYPLTLLAPSDRWRKALGCISVLGLSADVSISIAA